MSTSQYMLLLAASFLLFLTIKLCTPSIRGASNIYKFYWKKASLFRDIHFEALADVSITLSPKITSFVGTSLIQIIGQFKK